MIVYEVTAAAAAGLSVDFETYMRGEHIRDVLVTGYFTGASFFAHPRTVTASGMKRGARKT